MIAPKFMTPEIGRYYIGPAGRLFRVKAIEDNGGYPLVVIQRVPPRGHGEARFPIEQAGKWLKPI